MDKSQFVPLLLLWVPLIAALAVSSWKRRSVGMVAVYCFQLWMLYWLGGFIHALPWAELDEDEAVFLGFQQATWALAAFTAGALLLGPAVGRFLLRRARPELPGLLENSIARRYTILGLVAYFVLAPTVGHLPGFNAIPAVGSQLVIVGCCLSCWIAWQTKGRNALLRSLGPSVLIPLVILAKQGFMSYGVLAISAIGLFIAQFYKPRWVVAAIVIVSAYPGLTVYVTYMRDRGEIRASVWGEEDMSSRLSRLWETATNFELFDPRNPDHLDRIDGRLNQNPLVGEAVDALSRSDGFLRGESIKTALLGMIPRVIWPDKPPSGGSGDLVSRLTGREFAVGTSIGIGPVLEFYGNFGPAGVIIGFVLLGMIVSGFDIASADALWGARWGQFLMFFLVGNTFLNVGGSLVEVSAGAAAAFVIASVVRRIPAPAMTPVPAAAAG